MLFQYLGTRHRLTCHCPYIFSNHSSHIWMRQLQLSALDKIQIETLRSESFRTSYYIPDGKALLEDLQENSLNDVLI